MEKPLVDKDREGKQGGWGSTAHRCLQKDGDTRVSEKQGLKKCWTCSTQVQLIPGRIQEKQMPALTAR